MIALGRRVALLVGALIAGDTLATDSTTGLPWLTPAPASPAPSQAQFPDLFMTAAPVPATPAPLPPVPTAVSTLLAPVTVPPTPAVVPTPVAVPTGAPTTAAPATPAPATATPVPTAPPSTALGTAANTLFGGTVTVETEPTSTTLAATMAATSSTTAMAAPTSSTAAKQCEVPATVSNFRDITCNGDVYNPGEFFSDGDLCVPSCNSGYSSTVKSLICSHGILEPNIFECTQSSSGSSFAGPLIFFIVLAIAIGIGYYFFTRMGGQSHLDGTYGGAWKQRGTQGLTGAGQLDPYGNPQTNAQLHGGAGQYPYSQVGTNDYGAGSGSSFAPPRGGMGGIGAGVGSSFPGQQPGMLPPWKKEWTALTRQQQEAARSLGYVEHSWQNATGIPAEKIHWERLNSQQIYAIQELGYTQDTWNEQVDKCLRAERSGYGQMAGAMPDSFNQRPPGTMPGAYGQSQSAGQQPGPPSTGNWQSLMGGTSAAGGASAGYGTGSNYGAQGNQSQGFFGKLGAALSGGGTGSAPGTGYGAQGGGGYGPQGQGDYGGSTAGQGGGMFGSLSQMASGLMGGSNTAQGGAGYGGGYGGGAYGQPPPTTPALGGYGQPGTNPGAYGGGYGGQSGYNG